MKLLFIFIALNIVNVIIQTIKSLTTINCGKILASLTNAFAYGFYTIVVVYTLCDLPLFTKALIVGICNLIGVYVVKLIEEKMKKDKLWKIEMTVKNKNDLDSISLLLGKISIPYSILDTNSDAYIMNIYCATQKESICVKDIVNRFKVKYFVSESKIL